MSIKSSAGYKVLNHTADAGVIGYGADLPHAFAGAAKGLFSLITDLRTVREVTHRNIAVTAADRESLLVAWLNELLYLFDVENLLFRRFEISALSPTRLKARVYGEKVDPFRHEIKTGVKSTTYHLLQIKQDDGCRVRVIFDI